MSMGHRDRQHVSDPSESPVSSTVREGRVIQGKYTIFIQAQHYVLFMEYKMGNNIFKKMIVQIMFYYTHLTT